jgi:hypothetical protein
MVNVIPGQFERAEDGLDDHGDGDGGDNDGDDGSDSHGRTVSV